MDVLETQSTSGTITQRIAAHLFLSRPKVQPFSIHQPGSVTWTDVPSNKRFGEKQGGMMDRPLVREDQTSNTDSLLFIHACPSPVQRRPPPTPPFRSSAVFHGTYHPVSQKTEVYNLRYSFGGPALMLRMVGLDRLGLRERVDEMVPRSGLVRDSGM